MAALEINTMHLIYEYGAGNLYLRLAHFELLVTNSSKQAGKTGFKRFFAVLHTPTQTLSRGDYHSPHYFVLGKRIFWRVRQHQPQAAR